MKNKVTTKKIKRNELKFDPSYLRVSKHVNTPEFLGKAIKKFEYHVNLPVYERNDIYFQCGFGCVSDALEQLASEPENADALIEVDVIDMSDRDIIEFLLSFQYQEHKQERCIAELTMICEEYIAKEKNRNWLKEITGTGDKQKQYSILFGISESGAKCYLKLIRKENKHFLEMLADMQNGGLTKAYKECCDAEKKPKSPSDTVADKAPGKIQTEDKVGSPKTAPPTGTNDDDDDFLDDILSDESPAEEIGEEDGSDDEATEEYLALYKKDTAQTTAGQPHVGIIEKVIAVISDGKNLELTGITQLLVDEYNITSTAQLQQLPDGNWGLPATCKTYMLNVQS